MASQSTHNDLLAFLSDHIPPESRSALVSSAFYGQPALLREIDTRGTPRQFAHHVLTAALRHGDIDGRPALVHLLSALKGEVGTDKSAQLDRFIATYEAAPDQRALAGALAGMEPRPAVSRGLVIGSVALIALLLAGIGLFTAFSPAEIRAFFVPAPPLEPFADGEYGVVLAGFGELDDRADDDYNRVARALEEENVPTLPLDRSLTSRDEATALLDEYNATLVIWGESDFYGTNLFFEVAPSPNEFGLVFTVDEIELAADQPEFVARMREGSDALYIVNAVLAQLAIEEALTENESVIAALPYLRRAEELINPGRETEIKAYALYNHISYVLITSGDIEEGQAYSQRAIEANTDPQDALDYNILALSYRNVLEFEKSTEALSAGIEIAPDLMLLRQNRATLYGTLGEYEQALADFAVVEEAQPTNYYNLLNRAALHQSFGVYDLALADYDRALELAPDFAYAYIQRGNFFSQWGEFDRAHADLEQALALAPARSDAWVFLASLYIAQGNYDHGLKLFDAAVKLDPDNPTLYSARGFARLAAGFTDAALADQQRVIDIAPDLPSGYHGRAMVHRFLGDFDAALADHNRAIERLPDVPLYYPMRAATYTAMGDYEAALADYNTAGELAPLAPTYYAERGRIYALQGDLDAAVAELERARALGPESTYPDIVLTEIYRGAGDMRNALRAADRTVDRTPNLWGAYQLRAFTRFAAGNARAALADLDRAVELAPAQFALYNDRAQIYYSMGNEDLALADFAQSLERHNNNHAYTGLAIHYFYALEYEQAVDQATLALNYPSTDATAYLLRAMAYYQLGDLDNALTDLLAYEERGGQYPDNYSTFIATSIKLESGYEDPD